MKLPAGTIGVACVLGAGIFSYFQTRVPPDFGIPNSQSTHFSEMADAASVFAGARKEGAAQLPRCEAFEDPSDGKVHSKSTFVGASKKIIDELAGRPQLSSGEVVETPKLRVVVALIPDPVHTKLGLLFDRELDSIRQSAQDEGYDPESQWLPWPQEAAHLDVLLADRQASAEIARAREACPGVLTFRSHGLPSPERDGNKQYDKGGLIVFLVAERPTDGLNHTQWQNAVNWISSTSSPALGRNGMESLRVMGPVFSGSFDSLQYELSRSQLSKRFPNRLILSGSASDRTSISAFKTAIRESDSKFGTHTRFGTMTESDDLQLIRFLFYLSQKHATACSSVAVISEDDTTYGRLGVLPNEVCSRSADSLLLRRSRKPQESNQPLQLSYPRDISDVREAYRKQLIFESAFPNNRPLRAVLRMEEEARKADSDALNGYAEGAGILDKEAQLMGILEALASHHTTYIIIRSTNPLDQIFLSRFIHRYYPEAHVVTFGTDLLYAREIDTTDFRGQLAVTTFPGLPRIPGWSFEGEEAYRIFPSSLAASQYMAFRFSLGLLSMKQEAAKTCSNQCSPSLTVDDLESRVEDDIPLYGPPSWARSSADADISRPPTWVVALGREGYWPVSVLTDTPRTQPPLTSSLPPLIVPHVSAGSYYYSIPFASKVAICLALLLMLYQMGGLLNVCPSTSASLSFVFHNNYRLPWQSTLRGVSCALALLPLYELILPRLILLARADSSGAPHRQIGYWIVVGACTAGMGALASYFFAKEKDINVPGQSLFEFDPGMRKKARIEAFYAYCASIAVIGLEFYNEFGGKLFFHSGKPMAELFPTVYRMEHLNCGISPLVPLLLLSFGCYLWVWQLMAANLIVGIGRPELPYAKNVYSQSISNQAESLETIWESERAGQSWPAAAIVTVRRKMIDLFRWNFFEPKGRAVSITSLDRRWGLPFEMRRLGRRMARNVYMVANPFFVVNAAMATITGVFMLWMGWCERPYWKSFSLEGFRFSTFLLSVSSVGALLTILIGYRLYATWSQLRRVLLALNRTRMRDVFERIRPLSSVSLWTATTNVHRVQYRLFFQQFEALRRLVEVHKVKDDDGILKSALERGQIIVDRTRSELEKGMAVYWWVQFRPDTVDPEGRSIREIFRDATAYLIDESAAYWKRNPTSLFASERNTLERLPSLEDAEEFICAHYMGFIHIVVARMRTMTISMCILFVCVCFSLAFYPFVPHVYIRSLLVLDLFIIAAIVGYVYIAMDRDEVLSLMTKSQSGRIGLEFWLKYASFLIGPLVGIFATQNPALVDTILGWLQPGLGMGK